MQNAELFLLTTGRASFLDPHAHAGSMQQEQQSDKRPWDSQGLLPRRRAECNHNTKFPWEMKRPDII